MNLRAVLIASLGRRADLPTYLGGWVASMSWIYVVGQTIGATGQTTALALATTLGYLGSFTLRGCTDRSWWPLVEKGAVPLLNIGRLLFMLVLVPAAIGWGPLTVLFPGGTSGQEEWAIGTVFVWAMTLHSLTMFSDGLVAFASVLGVAMMGLMGTDNVNPEVGVAFLPFLLGNVLMLSNMGLTHYTAGRTGSQRHGRRPDGEQLARWLGDQFIVSGLTVALTAVIGILMGATLQTVMPRLMVPGVRMPPGLAGSTKTVGGFAAMGEDMVVGTGGGLPPETPLMVVACREPLLWRRRVYNHFSGRQWSRTKGDERRVGRSLSTGAMLIEPNVVESRTWRRRREVTQDIQALANTELAAAPLVTWVSPALTGQRGGPLLPDGDLRVPLVVGQQIRLLSSIPDPTQDDLKSAPFEKDFPDGECLNLPVSSAGAIEPLARRLAIGHKGPYDVARAIQDYLERTITYDAVVRAPESDGSVMNWFLDEKRGACDLIASAMVLLARANGIPARVASGYATGKPQADGRYLVTVAQAHAWAELHFQGLGWIPFNPAVQGQGDYAKTAELQARLARLLRLRWPVVVMGLMGLWLLLYVLNEWRKAWPRFQPSPAGRVELTYHRAQLALARVGRQRRRHETPREHLERLRVQDPGADYLADLTPVAEGYECVRYELGALDHERVQFIELAGRHLPQTLKRVRRPKVRGRFVQ
ncbi:MAG: transglutaminase domain-containing protein [Armatimonadetes bacterium]|nr:transglutaminase domain-containing protein [Armatimonadota bacterium]